jgi:type IV pilus secretin PilQ/predicted competence protein
MTAQSNKHTASNNSVTLTTASAAALGALAGTPATLAQAGDAFSLQKTPELISPDSKSQGEGAKVPVQGEIKVDEHLIVDLHVVDEELADVLQMLSIQSQRNIVASRNVAATVTATLYGVTFYEALDAILHVNGFGYIEEGNFIYVYTAEEIQRLIESSRERVSAVIPLDYINSSDAAEFAQALLSENGQIKAPGKTAPFQIPDSAPVGADDLATEAFIVVVDFEENVEAIRELLAQIDTKPSQVLVEATILQAALTENNAFGVDFSIIGSLNFGDFLGGPLSAVDNLISGQGEDVNGNPTQVPGGNNRSANATQSTVGRTDGPASLKVGLVQGDFAAFLRVLDEVTDTTIIARPKVLTLNRQPARVLVGERVGYLSSTTTQTGTTQTVEFLDTGTQLYFRPFVSRDGLIRMELKPQVSEAVIRDATDSGGASVTIPDETTNELTANVMVRDGQTIVLGGLFRERTQYTRRQVPWIADLPFIGAPFRGREDSTDRAEIIFMITPTIINDQIVSEHAERAKSLIDSAVSGTREGLLPFSRDKQASRLLVEAQQYAADGKTKKALYCVRRSLSLNPNQPQARLLLERLTTKTRTWPAQSVLQSTFDTEMDLYLDQHGEMFVPTPVETEDEMTFLEVEGTDTVIADIETTTGDDVEPTDEVVDVVAGDDADIIDEPVEDDATEVVAAGSDDEFIDGDTAEDGSSIELAEATDTAEGQEAEVEIDPAVAQAEADAASEASFDEAELASARDIETPSSESAFEDSDWIASLAQAEIGAAAASAPELAEEGELAETTETAEADQTEEVEQAEAPAIVFDAQARTFDINVQDAALPTLLRDLSTQARRSIIVAPEVAGTVSASLFGLSLEESLAAILPSQGYGFVEDGKVIRVLSVETIAAQQLAAAEALAQAESEQQRDDVVGLTGQDAQPTIDATDVASTPELAAAEGPATTVDQPLSLDTAEGETDTLEVASGEETVKDFSAEADTSGEADLELAIDFDEPSPIEDQIDDTLTDALLSSLSFNSFEWKPSVSRDGFTEPTSWTMGEPSFEEASPAEGQTDFDGSAADSSDATDAPEDAGETAEPVEATPAATGASSENGTQDS